MASVTPTNSEPAARISAALSDRAKWLVTGSAGFIGSHLLEELLHAGQTVVSLDNFSTGFRRNLEEVRLSVGDAAWSRHHFIEGDIRDISTCEAAVKGVDYVLHQAALGSVPRSIKDPVASNASNVTGFLNVLTASKNEGVKRFVYASSSSVYGDHPGLPKIESSVGRPLSPYAVTKAVNELYADVFARTYGLSVVGLRYFNVFGPRQDPDGPYAAVIPRWVKAVLRNEEITVNGDGETSRDFCFVKNVVLANVLSATSPFPDRAARVFNIAVGQQTTLNDLIKRITGLLSNCGGITAKSCVRHGEFRSGDVRHSLADISRARSELGYLPEYDLVRGLEAALPWYLGQFGNEVPSTG